MRRFLALTTATLLAAPLAAQTPLAGQPGVLLYGDIDRLGAGFANPADSYAGATLVGLAPGATSAATSSLGHGFPFTPGAGDFAGTDQIFAGSAQTGFHDGYSSFATRQHGPQTFTLDFSSLVASGTVVTSLTLGLGLDDFQFGSFGQPYVGTIGGSVYAPFSTLLNSVNQTGPATRFYTLGIDPALLSGNTLTLAIDQGGDGGDGWAIDYLTVGVQTKAVVTTPEPATLALAASGLLGLAVVVRRRRA